MKNYQFYRQDIVSEAQFTYNEEWDDNADLQSDS